MVVVAMMAFKLLHRQTKEEVMSSVERAGCPPWIPADRWCLAACRRIAVARQ